MAVSGQQIVDYLMQYKGRPYVWGGSNPDQGFDCSGLLQWGFAHFGIKIPRVTYGQIGQGKAIGMKDLQVGDMVFFDTESQAGPDHVGIYIGNGKMLHAPHTGDVIKISDISSDYYRSHFAGARRPSGMVGGGESNTNWSAQGPTEKKLSPEELAGKYGWAYGFLKADKELSSIFSQAVDGDWSVDKFQAKLHETNFWKKNSQTARLAIQMKTTDPATWAAKMNANKALIGDLASKVGAAVPDSMLPKLAEDMEMNGMDESMLRDVLAGYIDFSKNGTLKGEAGMHEYSMRQYADSMGVDMSDQSIKNYAQMMVKGMSTPQDFKNFINEQAMSAYPGFSEQIKAGQSMKNIANPYIQMMAQNLELSPNTISLKDPTIMAAMNGVGEDGKPSGMTLNDFEGLLRGDPRWKSTQQAMDKTMAVGNQVLKNMGLI